ncbi:MAG: F0F1 ATP synthase subunit delta [Anaerolineae bacterium]|nr:F0F1 ATP synthase subunit delta [Anaerolineae bacterium]
MLDLDLNTVIFQLVNFLVLATALYFLLFRPGMRKMKERKVEEEHIAQDIARDRQEAERLRATLENRLAGVEEEATAIFARAKEQAEVERTALLEEAEAEAERILAQAHTNADRLGSQTIDEFQDDLLGTILAISGQIIGQAAPPEVHDALIQQLNDRIWEMGRSEMGQVETLRRALGDREPTVYVTTAQPLTPEQQGLLARTFTALADRHVSIEVAIDPTLAAGVRARLGDMVIDNSIADRLESLRESVAQTLKEQVAGG